MKEIHALISWNVQTKGLEKQIEDAAKEEFIRKFPEIMELHVQTTYSSKAVS